MRTLWTEMYLMDRDKGVRYDIRDRAKPVEDKIHANLNWAISAKLWEPMGDSIENAVARKVDK